MADLNAIKDTLSTLTVMEVAELVKTLEEEWGVSAAAAAAPAAAAAGGEAAAEQTEFNVVMTTFGDNKISAIKAVRGITGLGLKEAKELVESAPAVIKEGVSKDDAADIQKQLVEAGATVELK